MTQTHRRDRLRFGPYEVDLHTRELWKHGTRVKLVGQPFDILAVFIGRPGQLVTREELHAELWPADTFVDFNHGLNTAVNKLRDALCDSAENPKYIETLPRRGYRFLATVELAAGESTQIEAAVEADRVVQAEMSSPDERGTQVEDEAASEARVPDFAAIVDHSNDWKRWWPRLLWTARVAVVIFALLFLMHWWGAFDESKPSGEKLEDEAKANPAFKGLTLLSDKFHRHVRKLEEEAKAAPAPKGLTLLTSLSDATSDPAFSPDGNRVAFRRESFVPGDSGIWIKQVDGEELVQLTNNSGDCSPVWAANGSTLVFSRIAGNQRTIYGVPATGGDVRQVYSGELAAGHGELDWSPDGNSIVFVGKGKQGLPSLFTLSQGKARQITNPSGADRDWGPAFSPDGNQIAFVRSDSIAVMPADGGEVRHLTRDPVRVAGSPRWAPDGASILFTTDELGELWRVPVAGGEPVVIRSVGTGVRNPVISRRGFRLACVGTSQARSIDEMGLYPAGQRPRLLVTSMKGENAGQQLSPDGKKMAFQSDRTGGMEIWVSNPDGQNAIQLTALGTAGAPRWSPDGKEIVFDVGLGRDWQQPRAVFVVNADGGSPRPLVQDGHSNPRPAWSRDGKWVYFASDRSGDWQIWKIAREGGTPIQVTKQGGFAAEESADGYLYYAKTRYDSPEIWRVPVNGGDEMPVYPGIRPLDWGAWTLVGSGILFVDWGEEGQATVSSYNFSTHSVKHLAALDQRPFWMTATADGKSVIFDRPEQEESHVMLLENFR